jgi:DNA-binding response OmpR family regulator
MTICPSFPENLVPFDVANLLFVAAHHPGSTSWKSSWVAHGHDVLSVTSIEKAISHMRDGGIDLVILDTDDSLGSMKHLVSNLDRLVDAPPLLLVSDSPTAPAVSAQIGAAGFIAKPCSADDVLVEIVKLVRPSRKNMFDEEPTGQHSVKSLSAE